MDLRQEWGERVPDGETSYAVTGPFLFVRKGDCFRVYKAQSDVLGNRSWAAHWSNPDDHKVPYFGLGAFSTGNLNEWVEHLIGELEWCPDVPTADDLIYACRAIAKTKETL